MGVNVLTDTIVKNYDGNTLEFANGKTIKSKTVIWAAGVTANTIDGISEKAISNGNRLIVNRVNKLIKQIMFLSLVIWQNGNSKNIQHGHPQLANVAIKPSKEFSKN